MKIAKAILVDACYFYQVRLVLRWAKISIRNDRFCALFRVLEPSMTSVAIDAKTSLLRSIDVLPRGSLRQDAPITT